MNDLGGGQLTHAIDKLINETKELTKPLKMQVGELANNAEQLEKIISDFPSQYQITESTIINGLAAFEALYFSMGQELVTDILSHRKGPMGTPGYAAIVVADGIFGDGTARGDLNLIFQFTEISMEMIFSFTKELTEVI